MTKILFTKEGTKIHFEFGGNVGDCMLGIHLMIKKLSQETGWSIEDLCEEIKHNEKEEGKTLDKFFKMYKCNEVYIK